MESPRIVDTSPSPPVALARLLYDSASVEDAERTLNAALDRPATASEAAARERLLAMRQLLEQHRTRCAWIARIRGTGLDDAPVHDDPIASCARLFDWAVEESEEGSVAAYSLGDPTLLAEATAEVVRVMAGWGVLGADRRALDLGCGIGRVARAVAPRLKEVHGIDIARRMVAAARRRCADLPNVFIMRSSGRDLAPFDSGTFELVYAVDSFPYIQRGGTALVERQFAEIARVLAPGGDVALFNFSYRADPGVDRRDVRALARAFGFEVIVNGARPFALWDGLAFHLRAARQ
jgi:SAM-dependent methyltransferase